MLQLCKAMQGAKKVTFTACHSGKLKLTFTSPNIISTSPKNVLMSRLISQSSLIWIPQKTSLARQTSYNRIHQPDSKTHQSWATFYARNVPKKMCKVVVFFSNKKKSVLHLQSFFWLIRPSDFFGCFRCLRCLALHDFIFCLSKLQI